MSLETITDDPRWRDIDLETLADRAVTATLRHLGIDGEICETSLLACDDARIAKLNAGFRGKAAATNVLSWPAQERAPARPGAMPDPPQADFTGEIALGDIAIAYDTCEREARDMAKPIGDHVTHLIVHGALHLLGFDHECDNDAALMERLEAEILGTLGLDNPYR